MAFIGRLPRGPLGTVRVHPHPSNQGFQPIQVKINYFLLIFFFIFRFLVSQELIDKYYTCIYEPIIDKGSRKKNSFFSGPTTKAFTPPPRQKKIFLRLPSGMPHFFMAVPIRAGGG